MSAETSADETEQLREENERLREELERTRRELSREKTANRIHEACIEALLPDELLPIGGEPEQ